MRKPICFLVLACAVTMRAQNHLDEKTAAGIVRRFAPPSMVRQSAAHRHEFPLREDYETGRLDRSGKTYIVAAYSNFLDGQVLLLAPRRNGSYYLAGKASPVGMAGDFPRVNLIDVDGDGFLEVIASFAGYRGAAPQWIFKWTGHNFVDLTPLVAVRGGKTTALRSAAFVDVDGDGRPEFLNSQTRDEESASVFKFRNGAFEEAGSVVYWYMFDGRPDPHPRTVNVARTDLDYTVTLMNGDRKGNHQAADASVVLNGRVVARARKGVFRTSVRLAHENEISVIVAGHRDSCVMVTIGRFDSSPVTK